MIAEKKHNLAIRGLSKKSVHALKRIASKNNRSLNMEVVSILSEVASIEIKNKETSKIKNHD